MSQLDVNNAFLYGDLDEEVYMKLPLGLAAESILKVCKLKKSLYGLKQASRQWYAKLSFFLKTNGYVQSLNDYSLFTKVTASSSTFVVVYVDDVLLTGTNLQEMDSLKEFLHIAFKIKDLGSLHHFLGMEFLNTTDGMILTQTQFIQQTLKDSYCSDLSPFVGPLEYPLKFSADATDFLPNPTPFRQLIGKLNFITNTRPDIAFTMQHLSQFMQKPTHSHMAAAHHALRYLKGTIDRTLLLNSTSSLLRC